MGTQYDYFFGLMIGDKLMMHRASTIREKLTLCITVVLVVHLIDHVCDKESWVGYFVEVRLSL